MEQTTLISEMQKFRFGSKIFCSDGEYGVLTQVGFDAATKQLTHIGLKAGRLFAKTMYLPYESVVDAGSDGVRLRVAFADMVETGKVETKATLLDHKSVIQLEGASGRGSLVLVAVHPDNGALAYLVAHGVHAGQDTLFPRDTIKAITAERAIIALNDEALQKMPLYRPDSVLQQEVEQILFDITPLHVDFPGMAIRVLDSVLYLDGNISSSLRGDLAVDQAAGVEGLLEIKNRLVGDDQLAADLALALGRDPRTHDLPMGVYPRLGAVRLSGAVHNEGQKAAAEEIARKFPGVRSVINDVIIDPKADMLRVMSAPEGGEASDKVPGSYVRHTK